MEFSIDKLKTKEFKENLKKIKEGIEIYDQLDVDAPEMEIQNEYNKYGNENKFNIGSIGSIITKDSSYYRKFGIEPPKINFQIHSHPKIIDGEQNEFMQFFSNNDILFSSRRNIDSCIMYRKKNENEKLDWFLKCVEYKNITNDLQEEYNKIFDDMSKNVIFNSTLNELLLNSSSAQEYFDKEKELFENQDKEKAKESKILGVKKLEEIEKKMDIKTKKIFTSNIKDKIKNNSKLITYVYSPKNIDDFVLKDIKDYELEEYNKKYNTKKNKNKLNNSPKNWKILSNNYMNDVEYANYLLNLKYNEYMIYNDLKNIFIDKTSYKTKELIDKKNNFIITLSDFVKDLRSQELIFCVKKNENSNKKCYKSSYNMNINYNLLPKEEEENDIKVYTTKSINEKNYQLKHEFNWY